LNNKKTKMKIAINKSCFEKFVQDLDWTKIGNSNFYKKNNKYTDKKKLMLKYKRSNFIGGVSGSAFTILNKGEIVENILFKTLTEARNYIKMKYPKRRFKEDKENVFVCCNYGTKFIIEELHYR